MKKLSYLILLFIIASCSNNKSVFWCGDHACINKKEKEAYFKKTMIVEVKELDKKNIKNDSEIEKITQQVIKDEKKRIKDEKELAKQIKLEEKRRIKEEKELAKQIKQDEKKLIIKKKPKMMKKNSKNKKIVTENSLEVSSEIIDVDLNSNKFKDLVEKITKKNSFRSYPDINDIPN